MLVKVCNVVWVTMAVVVTVGVDVTVVVTVVVMVCGAKVAVVGLMPLL